MAAASGDTVAIVDDDEPVRHSLRFLLEVMGYKVETFASADEFLKAELDKLLCLITDHHLPGITGLELTERLRTQGNSVPIMLITGLPSRAIYARARTLGVDEVLEKPPNESPPIGIHRHRQARPVTDHPKVVQVHPVAEQRIGARRWCATAQPNTREC
jgi:FixJ family two-component response regulator